MKLTEQEWKKSFKNRRDRLQRFLNLKAPEIIIVMEAFSVIEAYHHGFWKTFRYHFKLNIPSWKSILIHWWFKYSDAVGYTEVRKDGRHSVDCKHTHFERIREPLDDDDLGEFYNDECYLDVAPKIIKKFMS